MNNIMTFIFAFFCCLSLSLHAQTVTEIQKLRINDASGVPADTGKLFTISGIVTCAAELGTAGPGAVTDNSAGISIYGSSFAGLVSLGDSVTVTAVLTQFNGLSQLDFRRPGASMAKHRSACHFDTTIVTIAQMNSQKWNGLEEFESSIVRINNVTISGSGNFSSPTYKITDESGDTGNLYIDKQTNVFGTPVPADKVDIIGIVGQYDNSAPYSTGYQIIPRFRQDIADDGRPVIIGSVSAANIDSSSFTVFFTTARNGNSVVRYGLTESLELDSVRVDTLTTNHRVDITGLQKSKRYYFCVYSTNDKGTSSSQIYSVNTTGGVSSAGVINVYFNNSVDTSVAASGNKAQGNVNFASKLIERINVSSSSIDMAVYSFGLNDVANALIAAKNRGVKIRIVYQQRDPQISMQLLENAGIKVVRRSDDIMHNKFLVFDARDNNPNNDFVWTGSWNVTYNELYWKNNVVVINDQALAQAYTDEFQEMWGSSGDNPDLSNSRFGPYKKDNTAHYFNIGGRQVELYFSPSDQTERKISSAMARADSSVYFQTLTFTSDAIADSIYKAKTNGARDIRGLIDNVNDQGSEFEALKVYAEVFDYKSSSDVLHHKYGIIDASFPLCDPVVVTGSHNWTRSANEGNDENTLIIHDVLIANQFMQEFKKRYNEAGGTMSFVIPLVSSVEGEKKGSMPSGIVLHQNYPNPFNPVTTISFDIPEAAEAELSIYNTLGQRVKTLFKGYASAGRHVEDFNASALSSGVYLYVLKTKNAVFTRKLILLK